MSDEDILSIDETSFPRGLVTVHRIENGKVYFVSKRSDSDDWYAYKMLRSLFVEAVERENLCAGEKMPE